MLLWRSDVVSIAQARGRCFGVPETPGRSPVVIHLSASHGRLQGSRRLGTHSQPGRKPSFSPLYTPDMSTPVLQQVSAFMAGFARRQAGRITELPGGFAVCDEAFGLSRMNNQIFVDGAVDPQALPALAEEALGHLPHRLITVLDEASAEACASPLLRAGYSRSAYLVMLHEGPVASGAGTAEQVDLDALRAPLTRLWRDTLPDVEDEVVRHLVDRREARRRGADGVHFLAARTPEGEVASWADLYLDPATGIAQIEDLCTARDRLRKGYADVVLNTALRAAADAGCGTRFLTADASDWPRHWYERRGFSVMGRFSCFERD